MDRSEDWPVAVRDILAAGLTSTVRLARGGTWNIGWRSVDMFAPHNDDLYRECRAAIGEQLHQIVLMNREQHPAHVFEFIAMDAPAAGLGPVTWRHAGDAASTSFAVRRMRAYARGSDVFGEVLWTGGDAGVDRIVNPRLAQRGRERQEIAAALAGLRVLLSLAPASGGRPALTDTEALAGAVRVAREWLADHPGASASDFTRADLADRLCITPKSLDERMRTKHFTLRMVREQIR